MQYHLPVLKNSLGRASPIYIDLPMEVKEFARYDTVNHVIHVDEELLREWHEGTYELDVDIGYGQSTKEQRHRVKMFLIVENLKVILPDQDPVEPEPKPKKKIYKSRYGQVIPFDSVRTLDEFEVKKNLQPATPTGKEPVPTL